MKTNGTPAVIKRCIFFVFFLLYFLFGYSCTGADFETQSLKFSTKAVASEKMISGMQNRRMINNQHLCIKHLLMHKTSGDAKTNYLFVSRKIKFVVVKRKQSKT